MTKEQYKIEVRERLHLMKTMVGLYGEDMFNKKMVINKDLDNKTNWCWNVTRVEQLEKVVDNINLNPYLTTEQKDEIIEYGIRRTYNQLHSKLCEYILSALPFGKKESNDYSLTRDVYIYDKGYDVKMVDWNEGNPIYRCYRDYGQPKIWICTKSKTELSDVERVRSLINYLIEYIPSIKEEVVQGKHNIYIKGDSY